MNIISAKNLINMTNEELFDLYANRGKHPELLPQITAEMAVRFMGYISQGTVSFDDNGLATQWGRSAYRKEVAEQ